VGSTGLEPVTPSLSIRGRVRARSLRCAQTARLSRTCPVTERLSEPERTLILAILATRAQVVAAGAHWRYALDFSWALSRLAMSRRGS
jgi:hypothetical protein